MSFHLFLSIRNQIYGCHSAINFLSRRPHMHAQTHIQGRVDDFILLIYIDVLNFHQLKVSTAHFQHGK